MQDVQADEDEYKKTQAAERAKQAKMKKVQENVDKAREQNARRKLDKVCGPKIAVLWAAQRTCSLRPRCKTVNGIPGSPQRAIGSNPRRMGKSLLKTAKRSRRNRLGSVVQFVEEVVEAVVGGAEEAEWSLRPLRTRKEMLPPRALRVVLPRQRVHEDIYPCTPTYPLLVYHPC